MSVYKNTQVDVQDGGAATVAPTTAVTADQLDLADILRGMDSRLDRLFDFVKLAVSSEKVEPAGGWLLGRRSDGQACVWFYPPRDSALEFKLTTIWLEQFAELPFEVDATAETWPSSSPPSKREAYASGRMQACDLDLVFVANGELTEAGKPVYKFSHIAGSEPAPDVPNAPAVTPLPVTADRSALRTAVIDSASPEAAAVPVFGLFGESFRNAAGAGRFLTKICGNMPWDGRAALVACETYATLVTSGSEWRAAFASATAVYSYTAGVI
jgi:hypothetical protein